MMPSPSTPLSEHNSDVLVESISDLAALEKEIDQRVECGQIFDAFDHAQKALLLYPESKPLQLAKAMALLKTGAHEEARCVIHELYQWVKTFDDPMYDLHQHYVDRLASAFQQSWQAAGTTADLEVARDLYLKVFRLKGALYNGIMASALSWMLGEDALCHELASHLISITPTLSEGDRASLRHDQLLAYQAHAHLLMGHTPQAIELYKQTAVLLPKGYQSLVEVRSFLFFLEEGGFVVTPEIHALIPAPSILVFTGHALDRRDQTEAIFPRSLEGPVRQAIEQQLDALNAHIGYTSASSGADLLFIEAMHRRGAEVHIILPFETEDFIEHNVRYAGPRWERRFEQALSYAQSVTHATHDHFLGHDALYKFANQVMHGTAAIRAELLTTHPHLVALWNCKPGSLAGGAGDFIAEWDDISHLHVIDLDEIASQNGLQPARSIFETDTLPQTTSGPERQVKYMMFSDFAGYSSLQDQHIPAFLEFMSQVERDVHDRAVSIESINTWGDALFIVMNSASQIAEYALSFCDVVDNWGMRLYGVKPIRARISLHAGPVYRWEDAFLRKVNYYGSHINRAARLEPVTVVGQVYATQQFVALLHAEQNSLRFEAEQTGKPYVSKFVTEYVGYLGLAKHFSEEPIYHIRWYR